MKKVKNIFLLVIFGSVNCFGMDLATASALRKKDEKLLTGSLQTVQESRQMQTGLQSDGRLVLYSPSENPLVQKDSLAFLPSMSGVQLVGLGIIIGAGAVAYFGMKYCMPRYKE